MREIVLNTELEKVDITENSLENFMKWNIRLDNIIETQIADTVYHKSFIEYLKTAYDYHKGAMISPDDIWHVVLYELSQLIVKSPERYRDFFTKSSEKITISVPTSNPSHINLNLVIEKLKELVPSDTEDFLLDFSTTTPPSKMAINAAFCEAVSPYYNYMTFACGLPKIKVLGTKEDWNKITQSCTKLQSIFSDHVDYLEGIINLVYQLTEKRDVDYLSRVFNWKRKGSGSNLYIDGWVKDLFVDKNIKEFVECPRQISRVEYKNATTNTNYKLHCGIFSSDLDEDDYLVPNYDYIIQQLD